MPGSRRPAGRWGSGELSGDADNADWLVGIVICRHAIAIGQGVALACVPGLKAPEELAELKMDPPFFLPLLALAIVASLGIRNLTIGMLQTSASRRWKFR